MPTLDILLVDDHALLRDSVQSFLEKEPGIRVVGAVGDADAAVSAAVQLKPHVVVMDIEMPGRCPFAAARQIREQCPEANLLFLTAHISDRFIQKAHDAGAAGYLSKNQRSGALVQAIRDAACGQRVYSPDVRDRIVDGANNLTRSQILSRREEEVLGYVARGKTKKQIAEIMGLSIKTIEGHTDHLMKKLGVHNKVDLTRHAIREGWITP